MRKTARFIGAFDSRDPGNLPIALSEPADCCPFDVCSDLKAGNILLDKDGKVFVADFGVSGWLNKPGGSTQRQVGTSVLQWPLPACPITPRIVHL